MNSQLKDLIQKCEVCCSLHAKQPREPLQPHPIPERPWEVIGVDLFSLEDSAFLVTVDYYSGFWEIDQLQELGATSVIRCLKRHFARYGIPVKCVTDNGPQFYLEEFRRFSTEWGFTHTTSSPEFSQSNGKAESGVKVAKSLLRKAWAGNEDPWLAILGSRNTPTRESNTAPVQRFLGRRTRTQLPTRADQLLPGVEFSGVQEHLQRRQDSYQKSFDARAHALKPLVVGQVVRVQPSRHGRRWFKAKVLLHIAPRSYNILTESGSILRRNRRQLRPSPGEAFVEPDEEYPPGVREEEVELEGGEGEEEREEEGEEEQREVEEGEGQVNDEDQQREVRTQSGRLVRRPGWLRDYET